MVLRIKIIQMQVLLHERKKEREEEEEALSLMVMQTQGAMMEPVTKADQRMSRH